MAAGRWTWFGLVCIGLIGCGSSPGGDDLGGLGADLAGSAVDLATGGSTDLATGSAVDQASMSGVVDGCWVTYTSSGTTELHLTQSGSTVSGTETYSGGTEQITSGTFNGTELKLTVDWVTFTCQLDFTSVSSTSMQGQSDCAGNVQSITADRTCQ